MPSFTPSRRILFVTPFILLAIFGLAFEYHYNYFLPKATSLIPSFKSPTTTTPPPTWNFESNGEFWPSFAPLLAAAAPRVEPPELTQKASADLRSKSPQIHNGAQQNLLQWNESDIASMKGTHEWLLAQIQANPPKLQYEPGTKGIVTSAGGKYFPVFLVSLRMLRRTGSTLPVEIFLKNKDEYEELACEKLFKELGAKCVVLNQLIGDFGIRFGFKHFQLKAFGILFSSFEEVLFLDADNFPARKPEELFEMEVYKEKGMVLWPDYWTCTSSPFFNEVTGLGERVLQNRPTIEAGQILVDKKQHAETLSLAGYYNAYGDRYFYRLLTQGGPGEGDKETFGAASLILNNSFYTVYEPPRAFGSREGGAVLQMDPGEDWAANPENPNKDEHAPAPTPFFIHASWPPKLNPKYNYRNVRQWGPEEKSKEMFGEDLEPFVWGLMVDMACDDKVQFADWGDEKQTGRDGIGICEQTRQSFKDMFWREYGEDVGHNEGKGDREAKVVGKRQANA
jgi:alpha 1,2-mannosyltransferase